MKIEHQRVVVDGGIGTEVQIARMSCSSAKGRHGPTGRSRGASASRACPFRGLHEAVEIRRRAFHAVGIVEPAAQVEHGCRHSPVAAAQLRPVPPRILGRMRQPFEVVRRFLPQPRQVTQRQPRLIFLRDGGPFLLRIAVVRKAEPATRIRSDVLVDPRQPRRVEDAVHVEEICGATRRSSPAPWR